MSHPRSHFRIRFPQADRPRLSVGKDEYSVVNLSESGASLVAGGASQSWQSVVPVRLVFRDGVECQTTASVLRVEGSEMIIQFEKLIPQPMIIAEQRRLLQRYPKEALRDTSPEERKDSPPSE